MIRVIKMKKYLLLALSLAVFLASCKKENADSYYFHLHYVFNGELYDHYQGEPQKPERRGIFGSISDPKDAFSDVVRTPAGERQLRLPVC